MIDLGPPSAAFARSTSRAWCLPVQRAADGALQADVRPLVRAAQHQHHPLTVELRLCCPATGAVAECDWFSANDDAGAFNCASRLLRELHGSFFCCELFRRLKAEATASTSVYTTAADALAQERRTTAAESGASFLLSEWDFAFDRNGNHEEARVPRVHLLRFSEHAFTVQLGARHVLSCALVDRRAVKARSVLLGECEAAGSARLHVLCRLALVRAGLIIYGDCKSADEAGAISAPSAVEEPRASIGAPLSAIAALVVNAS